MRRKRRNPARHAQIALSTVFIAAIFFAGIAMFAFRKDMSVLENRVLTTFPKPNAADLMSTAWQKQVEQFASDQMPFRDSLTSLYKRVLYALGNRELDGVLVGRSADGTIRLFEAPDADAKRADRLSDTLRAIDQFASTVQAKTVLMPAPSSAMIYGEDLPSHADASETAMLYEFAVSSAEQYTTVNLLQAITAQKQNSGENLYFRTDHHWTVRGAYTAYQFYCAQMGLSPVQAGFEEISSDFLGTLHAKALLPSITADVLERPAMDLSSVRVRFGGGYGGLDGLAETSLYHDECLAQKDKYAYFLGGNYGLTLIENSTLGPDSPALLVIKDSFANALVPYLTANYGRIIMIDPRYYRGSAGDFTSLIETESPDTILFLYEINTLADDTFLQTLLERVL